VVFRVDEEKNKNEYGKQCGKQNAGGTGPKSVFVRISIAFDNPMLFVCRHPNKPVGCVVKNDADNARSAQTMLHAKSYGVHNVIPMKTHHGSFPQATI